MPDLHDDDGFGSSTGHDTRTRTKNRLTEPPMYHVILLNDDYTTMEFVIQVLQHVFHKNIAEATRVMLQVHRTGRGVAGTYTHDIARTKADQVMKMAFKESHPLRCILEQA